MAFLIQRRSGGEGFADHLFYYSLDDRTWRYATGLNGTLRALGLLAPFWLRRRERLTLLRHFQ